MKMKRYKIKDNTTLDDIFCSGAREGGSWVNKESEYLISKYCHFKKTGFDFSIDITFKKNILDWDDFENVIVLDLDFCQPYTPFYGENYGEEVTDFPTLEYCIEQYNEFMDSLPFLEEKE